MMYLIWKLNLVLDWQTDKKERKKGGYYTTSECLFVIDLIIIIDKKEQTNWNKEKYVREKENETS